MPAKLPDEVALKWQRNLLGATQRMKDGAMALTVSPGTSAAAKKSLWVAKMTDPKIQDKWAANTAAVSLTDWQKQFTVKGMQNLNAGVQAGTPNVEAFMQQLLPFTDNVSRTVKAMPKNNLQDSIARATKAIQMMSEFKYTKRRQF
jgi:hypothetical protein